MSEPRRRAIGRQVREVGVTLPGLTDARLKSLKTQMELAEAAGVSRATVTNAESGKVVAYASAEKLAHALGTTVQELQREPEEGGEQK